MDFVAGHIKAAGKALNKRGLVVPGTALIVLSTAMKVADDIKDLAFDAAVVTIHYVAKGATMVIRFTVKVPKYVVVAGLALGKKVYGQITDMTPATEPHDPSGDPIFAGPRKP